jgi:nucleoid DNA-binding protein
MSLASISAKQSARRWVYRVWNRQPFELVLKEITDCLEKGETVKLSSFGSFTVRKKNRRFGRNPKTGVAAQISARRVVIFKP